MELEQETGLMVAGTHFIFVMDWEVQHLAVLLQHLLKREVL